VSYRALYRVWRPKRFQDVVGQEHVTRTLINALKEGHLSHAYLFNGPRGTGKTSVARILATAVNCEHGPAPEPCGECAACRGIAEGTVMDVVEIDAASNRGVDEIRDLRDKVKYAPTEVRYKVYIIDEVHMLTTEAFNALLKTLEEPPAHVIFILATTEPHKLPPTIISRCQRFSFRRISFDRIVEHLRLILGSMQTEYEEAALFAIARAADGGMRDALSLLDQALAFAGNCLDEETVLAVTGAVSGESVLNLLEKVAERDAAASLAALDECIAGGMEPQRLLEDLTAVCRDLLLTKTAPELSELRHSLIRSGRGEELARKLSATKAAEMLDTLILYQQQMKWVSHPRILLELALVRLCRLRPTERDEQASQVRKLAERVAQLEETLKQLRQHPQSSPVEESTGEAEKGDVARRETRAPSKPLTWLDELGSERLSSTRFAEVRRHWQEIMQKIKEEKIMVHAWFIDGEPVGATDDAVIVAFKSKIHRETTEKESHRSLIEQVMSRVLGRPMRLRTCMASQWNEWKKRYSRDSSESEEDDSTGSGPGDVAVKRALEIFGKELVRIIDSE
jgi:DNA polymerase III subunit gamma/tau